MLPRIDLIMTEEISWLLMNNQDHISNSIRKDGFWGHTEMTIAKAFLANIQDSNTLDIGANLGGFTIPVAKFVAPLNGKVYSFEPQRIVFQQLCANIFLNGLDNVYAYNLALGESNCSRKIPELNFWESKNVGGFSVDEKIRKQINIDAIEGKTFINKENGNQYTVEQQKIDSFNIDFKINLIKVDIEGTELEFFLGGIKTIRKNKFPPIIFEIWGEKSWYKQKAEKTKNALVDLGYNLTIFGREILAQHPKHPRQCIIKKNGTKLELKVS